MQYAFINGKRQKPFLGGKGICPKCQRDVVARCGNINIWHWAHQKSCEPWSEPETEWHLGWKSYFPEDWQEVIIEDEQTGKTHRADVQTSEGLVIEFQNSSISSSEIQDREEFYQNMIWIVNAIDFKDNFSIGSVVNQKLQSLKSLINERKKSQSEFFNKQLNQAKTKLSLLKTKTLNLEIDIKKMEDQFNEYLEYLNYIDCISEILIEQLKEIRSRHDFSDPYSTTDMFIKKVETKNLILHKSRSYLILENRYNIAFEIRDLLKRINNIFLEKFIEINMFIKSLKIQYSSLHNQKEVLLKLSDSDFLTDSKVIPFEQIEKNMLLNIKCIEIKSKFTLFPVIYEMTEEKLSALLLQSTYQNYEFIINIKPEIEKINNQMHSIEIKINKNLLLRDHELTKEVTNFIEKWIIDRIYTVDIEVNKLNIQLKEKNEDLIKEQIEFEKLENDISSELKKRLKEIEDYSQKEKIRIMKKYKGLYHYKWSYKRKTWQFANETVYFDFGNGILYERIDDNLLRKMTRQDFLNQHLVTNV